jgi:hypothetical protein
LELVVSILLKCSIAQSRSIGSRRPGGRPGRGTEAQALTGDTDTCGGGSQDAALKYRPRKQFGQKRCPEWSFCVFGGVAEE